MLPSLLSRSWSAIQKVSVVVALCGCAQPACAQLIDTLDFFLIDDESIELKANDGSTVSQTTLGNAVLRVKFRVPTFHEYYLYDHDFIYLFYDASWGNNDGATSYEFTFIPGKGGKWMKRQMWVGESINVPLAQALKRYRDDCTYQRTDLFGYTNTLESYHPNYFIGGDLGSDEVIVLKYDWGEVERFYFARRWGWFRWEHYSASGQLLTAVQWDRISTRAPVQPQPKCKSFPAPCSRQNASCSRTWECTGRQCFSQPPGPGECQTGFEWCYAGCCCGCH